MSKTIAATAAMITVLSLMLFAGCVRAPSEPVPTDDQKTAVTNFEECVAAGNPVMESYPRQCNADGKNFVEEIDLPIELPNTADMDAEINGMNEVYTSEMTEAKARIIAEKTCIKGGEALTGDGYFNPNSKTWWFDANLNATQPGCNPACVVSEETGEAEINWRCTGLILPELAPLQ